ncbi:DUF4126 domain-containing protein [Novosphingobium sp. TH158]|uniref:DUF4126 domain-containing protein n=1 Tax=Novosphingobium sp. TH158 TaxID=2067455 RepID=UPI000C7CA961|nr:DUF4126 domain-containing protein [Novosphingobium sp. TH158]PLK27364.1 DUF4126 domain-containing protein [Novosphingobium sp. TH158]
MGIIEILGIAGSVSLLSGWRLYLCIFATGLAMRFSAWPLPEHLAALKVLANPMVIGLSGFAASVEFLADKVPWIDSGWDMVHTAIRPIGGAVLALALVDPSDPATQVIAFILGGGASLLTHGAKAGARAAVNTSPEPFSNIAVSTAEDITSAGLLWGAYAYPQVAAVIAGALLLFAVILLFAARALFRRLFGSRDPA